MGGIPLGFWIMDAVKENKYLYIKSVRKIGAHYTFNIHIYTILSKSRIGNVIL